MLKIFIKFFSYLLILLVIFILYLSFFGIETKSFNKLIQEEISKSNDKVKAKFNKVKILLNLSNFSTNIEVPNLVLLYEGKQIKVQNISTNFSIAKLIKKEFGINNASIETKDNNLSDVINFVRIYKNTPQLIILEKILKKGKISSKIELNFNKNGKLKKDYKFKGLIREAEIKLLNKDIISSIDLNFDFQNKLYLIEDAKIIYKDIKFSSKKINILDKDKYFLIEGDIGNKSSEFNKEKLSVFFRQNLKNLNFKDAKLSSDNNFSFKINKKFKISDFIFKSKIKLDKLNYNLDSEKFKDYLPSYNGSIDFDNHEIKLLFKKNHFSIKGGGIYVIGKESEKINYDIKNDGGNVKFQSKLNINKNPLNIKILNYKKKENEASTLFIEGEKKKDKTLFFKKILFNESKNNFLVENLSLSKDLKINFFKLVDLNFINENKKKIKFL